MATEQPKRRWRTDGPDYIVGSMSLRGAGGQVMWHRLGWSATAWAGSSAELERFYTLKPTTRYKSQTEATRADREALRRAKVAIEKWLEKQRSKKR